MVSGMGSRNDVLDGRAHWRHLANTVEQLCAAAAMSVSAARDGDAACSRITLRSLVCLTEWREHTGSRQSCELLGSGSVQSSFHTELDGEYRWQIDHRSPAVLVTSTLPLGDMWIICRSLVVFFLIFTDHFHTHTYTHTHTLTNNINWRHTAKKLTLTLALTVYDPGIPEHTHTDPTNLTRATNESNLQTGDVAGW